jgi:cytoskeletal protein CcmA (bactofilin family)
MRRRVSAICELAFVILAITASPAVARDSGSRHDREISVSGDITVAKGKTVHGPVITVEGNATIDGTVTDYVGVGDGNVTVSGHVTRGVVVVHGDAHISGRVEGDVVALSGRVVVTADGRVGGDVVSRLEPRVSRGTVAGAVKRVDLQGIFTGLIIGFLAFLWVAVTISIAVFGLVFVGLFPRAADTAAAAGKRVGASIGWGVLVGVIGPIVALLVLVTLVGIPLGLGMVGALNLLAPLGYVTTALIIGRIWVKGRSNRARIGAFFAGFGILRLAALVPGIGLLVWLGACIYGLGALSMAAWYGGRARSPEEPAPCDPEAAVLSASSPPSPSPPGDTPDSFEPQASEPSAPAASTSEPPAETTEPPTETTEAAAQDSPEPPTLAWTPTGTSTAPTDEGTPPSG